jgi:hypothetical protein
MEKIVCSHNAPAEAWRVPVAAPYKVLSDTRLPWIQRSDGKRVMYWHLANGEAYEDEMSLWLQIALIKDAMAELNHELWPCAFISTENREGAEETLYWVDEDDMVRMPDGSSFKSPFLFSKSPSTLMVQYSFHPGYEFSLDAFMNKKVAWAIKHEPGKFSFPLGVTHEVLHGLGLNHTKAPGDILNAYYDHRNKITDDTRQGLNFLQGADRLEALEEDPAGLFLIRNTLIRAGRDPDDPSKKFKANGIKHPSQRTGCLAKLIGWK